MRTDLPLHSKSKNRARHLKQIEATRIQRQRMAEAILKIILDNMSREEMIKMYFLLKSGHDVVFEKRQYGMATQLTLFWPEVFLPFELREFLQVEYPKHENVSESSDL